MILTLELLWSKFQIPESTIQIKSKITLQTNVMGESGVEGRNASGSLGCSPYMRFSNMPVFRRQASSTVR